ncbi:MAG: 1-acyl-sn-glycerol-3-phosphate acyltransferase [Helicobacteraceae bacterium]|jgi:1-acyl-sn-glycerol-3-phosphate acyltransferase|nr:1-acyl-sn-glycerol-3-phosphate acyltransferase [Helicobacteraceae bacterium]
MRFRSILFSLIYFPTLAVIFIAGSLAGIFIPYKWRFFVPICVFNIASFLLRVICGVKYRIEGRENPPKDRVFIAVSNHQSTWETYAIQTLIVPICTLLKRQLLWIPFVGWSIAFLRPIAIERSSPIAASRKVLKVGAERLKNGVSLLIFPEGTRTSVGEIKEFKKSAAVLAAKTGAPILPITHNAGACWPARTYLKRGGEIVMKIGALIETRGKSADQIHDEYTAWIRKTMSEL